MTDISPMDTVRRECLAALNRTDLSRSAAAKRIGISSAALSRWLAGKYDGDNSRIDQLVATWCATLDETEKNSISINLGVHCELLVTREIEATLSHAQAVSDIVLVHGVSGAGKSWAAKHYCTTRATTYYLQCTRAMRTMSGLLGRVSEACSAWVKNPSAMTYETAIIEQLRGRRALLVIDEAHHLPSGLIDELRCIRDQAECGLALVGNNEIRMTLARLPQVVGRIGIRLEKKSPVRVDVIRILNNIIGRELSRAEADAAMTAALAPGGLHTLIRMIGRSWITAQASGRAEISEEDIIAASDAIAGHAGKIIRRNHNRQAAK